MKSTRVFKILSAALAAVVVFYFLVQGVRYLTNPYAPPGCIPVPQS